MKDKLDKFSKKFAKLLGNSRARIVMLIIVVVIILGIILGIYRLTTSPSGASGSQVASIPQDIQSVPGGQKESQKYLSTLLQSNQLAAKNALSQGTSEIPTLVATPSDTAGGSYNSQAVRTTGSCNCCKCSSCCGGGGSNKPGADSVLNGLESSGAITPQTADAIRKLNSENLTPEEYANRLKELVAEGKLTPAQAKALLAAYKRDYKKHTQNPNDLVNGLLASGAISADTAKTLKALANKHLTPAQYAAELNKLVREGKLSPAAAARLMAAYQKNYGKAKPDDIVNGLLNSGAIDAATAAKLKKLNHSNLTPEQYAAELNKLVKEGKLTPAQAKALLAAYKKHHGGSATSTSPDDVVDGLLNSGAIDAATAAKLKKLNHSNLTPDQYAAELNKLVKEGKLTPAQARALLAAYKLKHAGATAAGKNLPKPGDLVDQLAQSGQVTAATAQKLKSLDGKNLSPEAYRRALQAMVADGELTQAQADKLANAYAAHHLKNAGNTDAGLINQLQASGSLSASTAAQLKKLAASNASPQQYADALKSLVESGQLDPATAAKLLQHYITNHAKTGDKGLKGIQENQAKQDLERQVAAFQQQAAEEQENADKETEAKTQKLSQAMRSQAQQLIASWKAPKQLSTGGAEAKKGEGAGSSAAASGKGSGSGSQSDKPVKQIIKAGDVMFAVLNTSVNSDRPGPVMATLVAGKYKGAKLLGSLQVTPDSERVILTFTHMTMKKWPASVSIQAVAINPDTAQTALASNVDHHYLLRYSALFASSFLQGYSQAIQQSGSTQVNSGFGSSTVTHPDLNPKEKFMVGLGQVGQNASTAAQQEFDRKPTVTVNSGVGLGILFTNGVSQPTFDSSKSTNTKGAK